MSLREVISKRRMIPNVIKKKPLKGNLFAQFDFFLIKLNKLLIFVCIFKTI